MRKKLRTFQVKIVQKLCAEVIVVTNVSTRNSSGAIKFFQRNLEKRKWELNKMSNS